ncbi:MAG: GGDEF domain-containing protein [Deltaproteobacteria bacterium]|nr:GGDEF domain-containing protein [Deltaproteobacteria bacterium]
MQSSRFESAQAALERYLTYGTDSANREDQLLIRRSRGFGLIGLVVVFFGGFLTGLTHGVAELTLASLGLMFFMVTGLWIGFVRGGRYIRPTTHAAMGVILAGIFFTSIWVSEATEISVIFPMLVILVITYVLGSRPAFYWTLVAIAGSGLTVFMTDLPSTSSASVMTAPGLFACRAVALFATFCFAAAERRVADRQSVELEFLAGHDSLTGLLNRRAFEERLTDALARGRRYDRQVALIMLDLDGFKSVNDLHGHAVGDELLRRLARRVAELTRETDAICRMGGDEFVLLIDDVRDEKHVAQHADRLLAAVMRSVEIEGTPIQVGASVGIAIQPDASDDAEGLMQSADRAMYVAKAAGGANVHCQALERAHPTDAGGPEWSTPRTRH